MFSTGHLVGDLARRAARGAFVTTLSQVLKLVFSVVSAMVLARLLQPEDYGLFGMAAVFTGFLGMFKDFGLSAVTVQQADITHEQVSGLFWINVAIGGVLTVISIASAPVVAWFFDERRLMAVTIAFGATFLLNGITVQHQALLKRQMRFTALVAVDLLAIVAASLVAITLAWYDFGVWSLVWSQLALASATTIALWIACAWRPGWPLRSAGVGKMVAFGGNLTGFGILNYWARSLDNLLIGRVWGAAQLGLYTRAYQLLMLPIDHIIEPATTVAVPALSRLTASPERYRAAYLRILEKLAMITIPAGATLMVTSDWLVALVLGPRWTGVAHIYAWLAVAGLFQPVASTSGWLFVTQARGREMLRWAFISCPIIMASIVIGLPWGATGVAATYATCQVVVMIPLLFWYVGRRGPVRTLDLYRAILPAVCAAGAVIPMLLAFRWLAAPGPAVGLVSSLLILLVIAVPVLAAFDTGRSALRDLRRLVRLIGFHRAPAGQRSGAAN